jgi:outer membrane lipoprotein-sorting protein
MIINCLLCALITLPICADAGHVKSEEQQQNLAEDVGVESATTTGANKQTSEDDTKIPFPVRQSFAHVCS